MELCQRVEKVCTPEYGSPRAWYKARQNVLSLITDGPDGRRGVPNVFFTLSCPDNWLPQLHGDDKQNKKLYSGILPPLRKKGEPPPTFHQRRQAAIQNCGVVGEFFWEKMKHFTDSYFGGYLQSAWHWVRAEFQQRGVLHGHGCARISRAPDLIGQGEKLLLLMLIKAKSNVPEIKELADRLSEDIKAELIAFTDSIADAWNRSLDGQKDGVATSKSEGNAYLSRSIWSCETAEEVTEWAIGVQQQCGRHVCGPNSKCRRRFPGKQKKG